MALRWILGLVGVVFVSLVVVYTVLYAQGVPPEELARRCDTSMPSWGYYQEQVKAQVGAGPVAEWAGRPVAVRTEDGRMEVTFALEPPWSSYAAAMPVLLRTPTGETVRNEGTRRDQDLRVYTFAVPDVAADAPPPWIELHYPHTERRLPLDGEGNWKAQVAP